MNKEQAIEQGKLVGNEVKTAIQSGFAVQRTKMTEAATQFVSVETHNIDTMAEFWLSGFGEVMGKTKKSEASTVIKAYAKDGKSVTEFKGEYNDWITHCRKLKNGEASPTEKTRSKHVSAKGIEKISDAITVMNAGQVKLLINRLFSQLKLVSGDNWEHAFLVQTEGILDELEGSKHPIFQNMAKDAYAVIAEYLESKAADDAKKAKAEKEQQDAATGTVSGDVSQGTVIEGESHRVPENTEESNLTLLDSPELAAMLDEELEQEAQNEEQQQAAA